jgi:renalase
MRLAVIGAGPAGLAAAWALRDSPVQAVVLEKSRGVSGRAATRRRSTPHGDWRVDHGANYVKAPAGSPARALLHGPALAEGLGDIARPVWTFDGEGSIRPGDPDRDRDGKWTWDGGISALGKRLAEASGAEVRTETPVTHLALTPSGWAVYTAGGPLAQPFDAVLLTPPAPQAADLLAASTLDPDRRAVLVDGLRAAPYRKQFALMLGFDRSLDRPAQAYALVNPDGDHPVAWLAFESDKPGRVPDGCDLLLAQMAPFWTRDHYAEGTDALWAAARPLLEDLVGGPLPDPLWIDHQRWRYALPSAPADAEALALGAELGLFFAGDAVAGEGRVHRALESGLDAARRIRAWGGG